ncbi:MAG: hypothetical protein LBC63_08785 [Holophagales bacterium]|jgi:hypothetical protein|nr:hypothetical protein [Holophagales bacterium]
MKEQKQESRQQPYKEGEPCTFSGTRHFWKWMKEQDKSIRVRLTLAIADAEGGKPGKRLIPMCNQKIAYRYQATGTGARQFLKMMGSPAFSKTLA